MIKEREGGILGAKGGEEVRAVVGGGDDIEQFNCVLRNKNGNYKTW